MSSGATPMQLTSCAGVGCVRVRSKGGGQGQLPSPTLPARALLAALCKHASWSHQLTICTCRPSNCLPCVLLRACRLAFATESEMEAAGVAALGPSGLWGEWRSLADHGTVVWMGDLNYR